MSRDSILIIFAALFVLLTPIVPQMLNLRIRVLRWMHLYALADWHERNIRVLVPVVRIILVVFALVLMAVGMRWS